MPGHVAPLTSGHDDHGAPVRRPLGHRHLPQRGGAVLGAPQPRGRGSVRERDVAGDAALGRPPGSWPAVVAAPSIRVAGAAGDLGDGRLEGGQRAQRPVAEAVPGRPGGQHLGTSGALKRASSDREMPTVTVLAWCLMASMGRVSSSMARVRAAVRSSTTRAGVPTLPCSARRASSGSCPVAWRSSEASRTAVRRLQVAVVAPAAQALEEGGRAGDRGAGPSWSSRSVPGRRPLDRLLDRAPGPRAAGGPGRRWPAPPRSRTGGRPWPTARRPAAGAPAGR